MIIAKTKSARRRTKASNRDRTTRTLRWGAVLCAAVGLAVLVAPARPSARSARPGNAQSGPSATTKQRSASSGAFDELARRANAANEANRVSEAIRLYQEALHLRPKWDEGWWRLGTLYYDADRYAEALAAFKTLVEVSPKLGPGWAMLGLCEFETSDYDNSLIHLERSRALGLGGNDELVNVTRYHAALLLIRRGDLEIAMNLLSSLVAHGVVPETVKVALGLTLLRVPLLPSQIDPSKDALIHAAGDIGLHIAQGSLDQADKAFGQLLKDYPRTPFLHYAYGAMLTQVSRYDDAEREFREEMRTTPESAMAYMQLAHIKLRLRKSQDALPMAKGAVKRAPQSFAAHYLLGRTLLDLGQVELAVKELETARRLGPFSPEVRYNLARAYAKAHREGEAEHERAEFARLNALLQREQKLGSEAAQSYRSSNERANLEPREVRNPGEPPPQ